MHNVFDRQKVLFLATAIGLAHIVIGISLFVVPYPVSVMATLHSLVFMAGYGPKAVATILILAGILAVYGAEFSEKHSVRAILFMPQLCLMLLQIWSLSSVFLDGVYPNGYAPPGGSWFILKDQIFPWIISVSHSLWLGAFLCLYGRKK